MDENEAQGRDKFLRSKQWGDRNTGENWANNAWSFLADFQRSIAHSIVEQRSNIFHGTGAYQCARGISEFSMQWTTPDEQGRFDREFEELYRYAGYIDETMDRTTIATRWDDFGLTMAWQAHSDQFQRLPQLRPDSTIFADSGQLPPKTGVYVSMDDPDATLQFAWTGSPSGRLLDATTFNNTGKSASSEIGRSRLWVDGDAMLRFVLDNLRNPDLTKDPFFEESKTPELAPTLVARNVFTSHPSRWCYVELVKDEFEPSRSEVEDAPRAREARRFDAGEQCAAEGFYFPPCSDELAKVFPVR